MTKKWMSGFLAATMMATVLAGCGGGSDPAATEGGDTAAEGGDSAAAESINVMVWDRGQDLAPGTTTIDNALTDWIKQEVKAEKNVDVTFVAVPRSESDEKVNAMLAGGNAPDIVMTYSREMFSDFAAKGGLADLGPALEAEGANIQKYLGDEILEVGVIDGVQYSIPAQRGAQECRHLGWIRKDWLDALGLAVPTTTQELVDALYAFKENDPGQVGDKLVPWAMGGNPSAERYFQTFVLSYVEDAFEGENQWLYQEAHAVLHPDAKEGFKVLNQLYNDGIIAADFAVDTNDDKYKQDISNGYAGFVLDDSVRPLNSQWFGTCQENVPTAVWVPVNCFTGADDTYQGNVSNPMYGAFNMVPKASEDKATAVVKYLDWMADPANAVKVEFSPSHTTDENGLPVALSDEEKLANEYPLNMGDFNIINKFYDYCGDPEKIAYAYMNAGWKGNNITLDFCKQVVASVQKDLFIYPTFPTNLPESAQYATSVQTALVQMGYRVISAPVDQFDATYEAEMAKVNQAGFDKILAEKTAYYEENLKG